MKNLENKISSLFQESEILNSALQKVNSGIIVINNKGKIIYTNNKAVPILKLLETHSTKDLPEIYQIKKHDGTKLRHDEMPLNIAFEKGIEANQQLIVTDKEGNIKHVNITATPIKNKKDKLQYVMIVYQDIPTHQLQKNELELALQDKELFFTAIEATSDIVVITDFYGKLIYINNATKNIFKLPADVDINTINIQDYHNKESWDIITKKMMPKALKTGAATGEVTFLLQNNKIIYTSQVLICKKNKENKVEFFASISRDISEIKNKEIEIKKQQEYLYSIIDANPNLIFVKDHFGRYKLVNKKFSKVTGTTVKSILGKSDFEIPVAKEAANRYCEEDQKILSGKVKSLILEEKYHSLKSKEEFWLQTVKTGIQLNDNSIEILGVSTDITAIKKIEKDLKTQLRFNELLAKISSDFFSIDYTEIDNVMVESLKTICANTGMTRAMIGTIDAERKIQYKHVWSNNPDDGILHGKHQLNNVKDIDFKWVFQEIERRGFAFSTSKEFMVEDSLEKNFLEKTGLKSFLVFPLQIKNKRSGYLIMSSFDNADLPKPELIFIKTVCQILSTAIEKAETEKLLNFRLKFEELINGISSKFINIDPDLINEEINRTLKSIGSFIQADQAYVFAYNKEKKVLNLTNSWFLDNRNPSDGYYWDIPYDAFPWAFKFIQKNTFLEIANTNHIPEEGAMLRDVMVSGGVKSMLAIPISIRKEFKGAFIIASFEKEKFWHDQIIPLFKILGQIIANALERKKSEEEIRESESLYRTIASSIPKTAVIVFDKDLKIKIAEGLNEQVTNVKKEEIEGNYLNKIQHDGSLHFGVNEYNEHKNYYQRVLQGESIQIEKSYGNKYFQIYMLPIKNKKKEIISGLLISFDITEFKGFQQKLQNQAVELQRSNEDLEQFAYAASHDLQEPLRMVSSYVHLIQRKLGDNLSPDIKEFIFYATDGVIRMQDLINDLLEYSRVERKGKDFTTIDLNKVIQAVKFNLQKNITDNNAEIICELLPKIKADYSQISSLFQNLIDNAIKFKSERQPLIQIGFTEQKSKYTFFVKDNGIGIDKKYADRIFVIFQRLNNRTLYPGTGIGLAICKKIVERHGGKIWIESKIDQDTTFFFEIKK